MKLMHGIALGVLVGVLFGAATQGADQVPLIDLSASGIGERLAPNCAQVSWEVSDKPQAPGLVVRVAPGDNGYPGVGLKPEGEVWDLSAFGHVEARIVNTGDKAFGVSMRVDNPGDWQLSPWNCEEVRIEPGQTAAAKVIFGFGYGFKPNYRLDPANVSQVLFFTRQASPPLSFRIESVTAAGPAGETPPVKPEDVRIKPLNGYLLGGPVKLDAAAQIDARDGARAGVVEEAGRPAAEVTCPAGRESHQVRFRPPVGRWDLTEVCEVRVKLTNTGNTPVAPSVQVSSGRHRATDTVACDGPLAAGATTELVVPFAPAIPWSGPATEVTRANEGGERGTGTEFLSDRVDAVSLTVRHEEEATLRVESITALATPADAPDWLGHRPPVNGDWTISFNDDFDGAAVDLAKWNVYGPNWWGAKTLTHWSKDNVVVGDGVSRIHFEKKTGFHNDDPDSGHQSPYTGGYLDTYGKWAQRYGYFESRMKLPTAPGLWPAFWMMPDRGPAGGPQWKRQDTARGGMEFDIMENLTRWGPCRYNIALHWDGYQKDHKSVGSTTVYVRPDKDGFITCGLLWTPGSAVFYCNGEKVASWADDRISTVPSVMMFTLPVGGWDNNRLDDARLPDDFVIDYVRVWQREDLASDADGPMAQPEAAPAP